MKELQEILKTVSRFAPDERAILATVVDVHGSSYRLAGARMLIDADGNSIGTVSGGCLEADVLEHAKKVLASGEPQIITYDTMQDENSVFGLGMGCRGVVRVLLESVAARNVLFATLQRASNDRHRQIIATVINAPEGFGVGGRLYYDAREFHAVHFPESLRGNEELKADCVRSHDERLKSFGKTYETEQGGFELFIEVIEPPVSLLLFGAGHDARPLAAFADQLGWHVTVIDHREAWATRERFPGAKSIIRSRPENLDNSIFADENSVAIVMTHSYERDGEILPMLMNSKCSYIGALGPKTRTERLLKESGQIFSAEQHARLYAPVGLDIGADSPESIAMSIVAEIQAVLAERDGGFLRYRVGTIYNRKRSGNIGIIVLAAGASTRLGRPKLSVVFFGKTLLQIAVEAAVESKAAHAILVVSEKTPLQENEFAELPIHLAFNEHWAEGISTSIRIGLKKMIEIDKDIEAVIITLADQYLIGSPEIDSLIDKYRNTEKPIIASRYNRIWGVPALFARETFDELFALEGDMGARDVIKDFEVLKVGTVDMLEAEFDMDTPDDLERLDEVQ